MKPKERGLNIALDIRVGCDLYSGIGNYIRSLIKAIKEIDTSNKYFLFSNKFPEYITKYFPENHRKIKTIYSYEDHIIGDLWCNSILPLRLLIDKIDIYHGPSNIIPLLGIGNKRLKRVVTIHDMVSYTHPHLLPKKYGYYMRYMIASCIKKADKIIAVSQNTMRDIQEYVDIQREKISVIYESGSDIYRPIREKERLEDIKKRYNIRHDFILCVGKDEPRKNLIRLFNAFSLVAHRIRNDIEIELVICIGSSEISPQMKWAIKRSKMGENVILLKSIALADLPLLYNASILFILPSLYEGFGLPLIEAMQCGIPIIASNVSSIPEIVGGAGILIDPEDTEDIGSAIERVIYDNELRKRIGNDALIQSRRFSWENTARETLSIYNELATNRCVASNILYTKI